MQRPSALGAATLAALLVAVTSCTSSNESSPSAPSSSTVAPSAVLATGQDPTSVPTVTDPPSPPPTAVATVVVTTGIEPVATDASTTIDSTYISTSPPTDIVQIGTSVEGRPITVHRRGTPGGRKIVVIGVIHGDERAGHQIVDMLDAMDVPDGEELWLVPTMNPDGFAADVRHNANGVDLNRNFPYNWGPIGDLGYWEYAGPAAASEPETQAIVAFLTDLQPDLTIWYHQDYNRIAPGRGRDGAVRARYSELTGVPLLAISGGTYTGVAATWARTMLPDGVAFIVELGATLDPESALVHAQAVLTIGSELG